MKTPPQDLVIGELTSALAGHWGLCPVAMRYAALGFGSHHWIVDERGRRRWFVTVDDLRAEHLDSDGNEERSYCRLAAALQTAAALRDVAGLPFVIGPLADATGQFSVRLGPHHAVAVYPLLDVEPNDSSTFCTPGDREEALRLVGQLHNVTERISLHGLQRDTLAISNRTGLKAALRSLDVAWSAGPFAEPVRTLLGDYAGAILDRLCQLDVAANAVMADRSTWVLTHGEPHAANAVRTRDGRLVLVDWDTVAFAPPERDLWMLVDKRNPDWSAYRDVTGVTSLSEPAMDAYRQWWTLSEIAVYVAWFRKPHERTDDTENAWTELHHYLASL